MRPTVYFCAYRAAVECAATLTPGDKRRLICARKIGALVVRLIVERPKMSWHFTVGLRVKGKADRMVVDAEDALIAALKAKADQPGATIIYVRRSNRRGDTRHPPRPHIGGD